MDAMTTEIPGPADESLIRRAADGDETALAELITRFVSPRCREVSRWTIMRINPP